MEYRNKQLQTRNEGGEEMANQVGKRYICKKCNAEYIVTRAGEGALMCCNQPAEIKK